MIKIVSEKNQIDLSGVSPGLPYEISYVDKNGRFKTKTGKWGLLRESGEILVEPTYDQMSIFSNHLALVKKDNKYGYIDDTGRPVIGFEGGEPFLDNATGFKDGLAEVSLYNKKYFIDYMGHFFEEKQPEKQTLFIKNKPTNKYLNILRNQLSDLHFPKKQSSFKKQAAGEQPREEIKFIAEIYGALGKNRKMYNKQICSILEENRSAEFDRESVQFWVDLVWAEIAKNEEIQTWLEKQDKQDRDKINRVHKLLKDLGITVEKVKKGLSQHLWYSTDESILHLLKMKDIPASSELQDNGEDIPVYKINNKTQLLIQGNNIFIKPIKPSGDQDDN